MRRPWMMGLALLCACPAATFEQQRLADGTWQLLCRAPMDACVRELEKTCKEKRYRIVGGSSEMRLRDAPPYETEYRTTRLGFVCTSSDAPSTSSSAGDASRPCGPGATRACVGT